MEKETNAKESVDCAEGDENKSKTDSAKLENADECSTVKEKDELVKTGNETEGKSSPVEDIVDPPSASGDDITMKESNEKVADVQPGMKTVKVVLTRKMSTGSNKSTKSESGLKNGDTAKVISTKDKPMLTEDKKVPASTSQSTVASPSVGSRNSTNTPTPPSNTRSTRSQNPEFLARQRTFLQKVHLASNNRIIDDDLLTDDDDDNSKVTSKSSGSMGTSHSEENSVVDNVPTKRKRERSASNGTLSPRIPSPSVTNMLGGSVSANNSGSSSPAVSQMQPATKKRRNTRSDSSGTQQSILGASTGIEASEDRFCWVCHKDGIVMKCATCPRVFHLRCIQLETAPTEDWVCPECMTILHAENVDTRSRAMQLLSLEQLCNLLKFAVSRMKSYSGAEPFWKPVDLTEFSQYREYVAHPMDLSLLERNIKKRIYGSTEAFVADTKWMLHNCIIFNTYQSRLTGVAKMLVKICRQEMAEIENCPDCYLNAHTRKDSWFIEVCRRPHVLVWAKLKGFPFWPAKVMRTNKEGMVDVRFFGAHDRAWVPTRECFLYSKAIPASARNKKRNNLEACIEEVEQHTKKLREKFGMFHHAPFRTNFEPGQEAEHLKMLLPNYNPDNDGPPSSKRNKLHGGGYAVRTYQRSNHNERETQKQRSYSKPEASENIDDLMDGDKLKKYEKKKTENENTEGDYSRRISRPRKRTASGSRASRQSSLSSECSQESDITTQNKKNNSAKSASLIEWSRFEESAVHISVGVEGLASDEDKQSVTSDDRKLTRDGDDSGDAVLPADCSKSIEGESENKTGNNVENTKSTNSQVVNKSFSGQSIVDKLQEKLLRLEGSSDSDDAMSCKNGVEDKTKKTEDDSKNPEDCETQNKPTVSSKKMSETDIESIPEKTSVKTKEKQESSITDKETTERERSKSPIVNKFPHKSDPKRYGKQYFPKVVLYNMVLPKDLNLSKENNSEEDSATKQNSDKIVEQKDSVQEPICKSSSSLVSETASRLQNLLKNRIEESENHMTDTSHDSESSSSQDNESDSIKLSLDEGEPDIEEEKDAETNSTSSESMSDSGEDSVELDSLKHTPKHGYNRSGINGNPLEDNENPLDDDEKSNNSDNVTVGTVVEMEVNNEKSGNSDKVAIETVTEKEKNEDEVNTSTTSIESTEDPNEEPKSMNKINEEENSGVDIGLEPKTKEVTADESPPDKEVPDEDVPSTELLNTKSSKEILTDDQKSEKGKQGVDEEVDREVSDKKDLASDVTPTGFDDTVTEGVDKNACDGNGKDISNKDDEVDDAESDKLLNLEHSEDNIENVKDVSVEGAETTDNINRARTLTVNNGGSDDNADRESEKDGNRESDKDSSMEIDENNRESDKDSNRKSYMGSNRESDKNSISESDKNIISESNKDSNRESDKDCNKESDKGSNKESDKDSSMEIDENNRETDKGSNRESDKDNSMEIDENNKENDKNSNRENEVINSESNNKSSDPDVVLESERERKSNKGNGKESDNVSMLTREDIKTEISVDADKEHDQHSNTENDAEIQKDSSENDKQIANEDDSNDEDSSETNSSNTAKYRSKSNKSLDKKIKELSDGSRTEATIGSGVTITPADSTKTAKSKSAGSPATKEGDSTIEKHIKEEPVDPDEMLTESSVSSSTLSSTSSTVSSAKSSPAGKQATGANEKKGSDVENGLQTDKGLINKKLTVLEDKERPSSNDSPASMSDKEGIFPALFLDPSITITVINEKQSDSVDEPSVSKTKVSGSDINVNELRASVNLSKDISLTVVGAGYSGSSKEPTTSLDMECVHESDPEDSENSTNTNSSSVPLNIPSTVAGQNAIKQKKAKSSGGSESQLARSRARKSFPVKPTVSGIKVKSHPELVNGIGSLNNKTSVRRNSSGGNSSSSDSRRSSFGTSPHEVLMPEHQPRGENINRNNSTSDNNNNGNNNNGSGMVVLPPLLGNPPVPITNHIQALRAVNGSIGNPPHMTNGVADVRMMPAPSGQSYQIPSNSRISPAGHGSNASGSRYPPLHPRPAGPLLAQLPPTTPAEAGPVSAELDKHKLRLSEYFKVALEETIRDLAELKVPKVKDIAHAMEMEKLKWQHNQEILEIKHNTDLIIMEMRANHENELKRREAEVHAKRDIQEQRIVGETKKKQWCTLCGKEALFYCCWNTSYCDYPCQQEHWPSHMGTCAQNNNPANADALEGRQRNSPQTPVNIVHPHKPGNAAKQPWLDSVPMFNPATSSASIANRGSSNRTTESPSTSVTDDDYDSNNNFETSQREGSQDSDGRDFIKLDDLLAMGVDVPKMQKKRKRCGKCSGCTTVGNCGQCPPCNNTRTHQVCRRRRCINLMTESVGYASAKKNFINSQQPKMQPGLTNMPNGPNGPNGPSGPNGGKHMAGPPPPGYGAGVMPPQPGHGRGMAGPMGRMPHQYGGMVCPRPGNIQVSGFTSSQPSTTTTALVTSSTGNFIILPTLKTTASLAGNIGDGQNSHSVTLNSNALLNGIKMSVSNEAQNTTGKAPSNFSSSVISPIQESSVQITETNNFSTDQTVDTCASATPMLVGIISPNVGPSISAATTVTQNFPVFVTPQSMVPNVLYQSTDFYNP